MVTAFILFVLFLIVVAIFQVFYNRIWGDHPEAFPFTEVLNRHNSSQAGNPANYERANANYERAKSLIRHYLGRDILGSDVFQITVSDVEVKFWVYEVDAFQRRTLREDGLNVDYRIEAFERDHLE